MPRGPGRPSRPGPTARFELLSRAHRHNTPVLGICAGAQFLAEALGGGRAPMGSERIGWSEIRPVVGRVPTGPWFQWHADRIVAPPGAEVLADSPDGPEVFRLGTSAGVQFHPEMSADLLDRWLDATPLPADRAEALHRDTARFESRARAEELLRVLDLV
ncbi:gamma-glutamyl-gamma-aminobutyrate hydrolase family protein [Actinomycetospora endophytica]|uniref:Gamma-glutamyl-gamma-aminobutyrate hydrolase family protein n=1 Tax=Actinomycetospora endophytica TaxID=2291215 RepID=A0ABS8PJD6_9PSEU|nr:gamma-glutamyl-gamma-aminobutyrate hydrolase family protein [Actinomycetospora endophytica]